jgi:hypothetical protein
LALQEDPIVNIDGDLGNITLVFMGIFLAHVLHFDGC